MIKYILSNGTKEIVLYPMMHVNSQDFYDVRQELWTKDHLKGHKLHLEGFKSPERYASTSRKLYSLLGEIVGYDQQPKPIVEHEVHDLTYEELSMQNKMSFHFLIGLMNVGYIAIKKAYKDNPEYVKNELLKVWENGFSDEDQGLLDKLGLKKFLVYDRNKHAIEKALTEPANVSLIWGAAHIPDMIDVFRQHGYQVTQSILNPSN